MYFKSCEEVAKEIFDKNGKRVSRQFVSQTVKSALKKVFRNLEQKKPNLSKKEVFGLLCLLFGFTKSIQIKEFYDSFPKKIRDEIYISAEESIK